MTLRTILVCLTTKSDAQDLLPLAVPLARRFNAHLIGLHTTEPLVVYPGVAMHVPSGVYAEFQDRQMDQAAEIQQVFEAQTQAEDFVSEWRLQKSGALGAGERMLESARTADLVLMAQSASDAESPGQSFLLEYLIRQSGRPVLVVPKGASPEPLGREILIGWSPTREAARAAHDALALAEEGAHVSILSVSHSSADNAAALDSAKDLAASLDRHGLKARVESRSLQGQSVAECLLQTAFEHGSDLVVTGAFGHSRVYDFVIGAATLDLMKSAKVPVLFSK